MFMFVIWKKKCSRAFCSSRVTNASLLKIKYFKKNIFFPNKRNCSYLTDFFFLSSVNLVPDIGMGAYLKIFRGGAFQLKNIGSMTSLLLVK